MSTHSRNSFIYLSLLSLLIFTGFYLTEKITVLNNMTILSTVCSHFLIVINSFIIYWFGFKYSADRFVSLLVSAFYLASPTHYDAFFFSSGLQVQIAETLLLLFFVSYYLHQQYRSFIFYTLSTLFNSKFIVFCPLLCFSKKFTLKQKLFFVVNFFIQLIYLIPNLTEQKQYILHKINTLFYMGEVLILPPILTILNPSILIRDFYSPFVYIAIIFILIAFATMSFIKKYPTHFVILVIFTVILGVLIPTKQLFGNNEILYYFTPTSFPIVLYLFLWTVFYILKKFNSNKMIMISTSLWVLIWVQAGINFQINNRSQLIAWDNALKNLPADYNLEKKVKISYAQVLIEKKEDLEAEEFINLAKKKFPDIEWYSMLMSLALKKNDSQKIQQLFLDLDENKIPFTSPSKK